MDGLFFVRQKMKSWFARYDLYLMPAVKFLVMLVTLLMLNWHLGYRYVMMKWVLVILASLISCLMPWSGMTAVAGLWLLGHVSALSWEGAVVLAVLMFVAVLLHYLFLPGGSFLIVLLCMAFYLKIPYLVPLLAGLLGSVLYFIPVGIGVVIYYMMLCLERNAAYLGDPGSSIADCFLQVLGGLKGNQEMMLTLVAFCLVVLAVYALSHLSFDYAGIIAVATGGVLIVLFFLLGGFLMNISISYMGVFVSCVFCCILSVVLSFWGDVLDYSRPEYLQYEDDEYVYYVKAIPKLALSEPERQVKEITSRRENRNTGGRE